MLNLNKKSTAKQSNRSDLKRTYLKVFSFAFFCMFFAMTANAQNVNIWATSSNDVITKNGSVTKIDMQEDPSIMDAIDQIPVSNLLKPASDLIDGHDGCLYGTTSQGGEKNVGVFYKIDKTSKRMEVLSDINFLTYPGVTITFDDKNDQVYGFAAYGGANNKGSIFSYDKAFNEYKELFAWKDVLNGAIPLGKPVVHDGHIYGVTEFGGEYESGVLFSYDIEKGELTILKHFEDFVTGGKPCSEFVVHNNRIFGTTKLGGKYDGGTIYCYDLNNNKFSVMYNFIESDGKGGRALNVVNENYLMGCTVAGGEYDLGVLYTFNLSTRAYTKKIDFNWNNGAQPEAKLVETDKYQYVGYTTSGGHNGAGVYFSYDLEKNVLTKNFDFENEANSKINYSSFLVVNLNDKESVNESPILTGFSPTNETNDLIVQSEQADDSYLLLGNSKSAAK
ncbi:MAG: hypothetical protein R2730_14910 [Chitinophagales bacterium]